MKNRGGPAFPIERKGIVWSGMDLRDWFAGMVMCGLMANPNVDLKHISNAPGGFSLSIYKMADTMLEEREKE